MVFMGPDQTTQHGLGAWLAWYRDMGVDCALCDLPVNWRSPPNKAPGADFELALDVDTEVDASAGVAPSRVAPQSLPADLKPQADVSSTQQRRFSVPVTPAAPDAVLTAARTAARAASSIDALGAALSRFEGCGLKATAKNLCFYRGAPQARVMIIGEAPGREEDLAGQPFVGPAGRLLDKMLAAIGLDETTVHITNIVYWRPPGNRTPTPQEAQACRPFLERQVELVAPDIVVALGGAAAKNLLDTTEGIMRTRGKWSERTFGTRRVRMLATLHPAYLLRTPASKRLVWRDLLALKAALGSTA